LRESKVYENQGKTSLQNKLANLAKSMTKARPRKQGREQTQRATKQNASTYQDAL